ncbi:hypothetical protein RE654_00120 [Aeromonas caviae]|uniref:hypothetical protein n=1 Tax=Aeromonas TaxID=642 RepID=UPI00286889E9|nr:hypothetical protein [Aeromonas caviae]WMX34722.1 hypothetical protein RE654_00120 [Aeromonas caviae]
MKNDLLTLAQSVREEMILNGKDPRRDNLLLFTSDRNDISMSRAALTNYISLKSEGAYIPEWLDDFINQIILRVYEKREALPTYGKRSKCPRVAALVKVTYERCYIVDGQRDTKLRGLIAACLECDPRTVSNYKAMTGYEVDIFTHIFRDSYPEKRTKVGRNAMRQEMLDTLAELAKKNFNVELAELDPSLISLFYTFHPSARPRRKAPWMLAQETLVRPQEQSGLLESTLRSIQPVFLELMDSYKSFSEKLSKLEEVILEAVENVNKHL